MNKYLSYDEERAPKVREMFTRLAARYDLVNDVMSFGMHRKWKREAVRLALEGRKKARLLDLCCGTGAMCFYARRMGADGVVGADFTLPMLAVGRRRARVEGEGTDFVAADALRLPFRDGAFDAITVGYGLRNVADPKLALSEMRRTLAPGGRVVVLDFGKPDNAVARALHNSYLRSMVPAVGGAFHHDPQKYSHIPHSLERYPAQRGVENIMRDVGFTNVRYYNRLLGTMGFNVGETSG